MSAFKYFAVYSHNHLVFFLITSTVDLICSKSEFDNNTNNTNKPHSKISKPYQNELKSLEKKFNNYQACSASGVDFTTGKNAQSLHKAWPNVVVD